MTIAKWILPFFLLFSAKAAGLRGEIQRFTLMHDRLTIDRGLREDHYAHFLSIDLLVSSGLKNLLGDVSNGTEGVTNPVQKQLNMFELLSKYVNSEKLVDAQVYAGMPLPDIKIKKHKFLNSLFYELNLGVMFTISNKLSATNPSAQTYVRKQTKVGLMTTYQRVKKEIWELALYQLTRSDLSASVTSSQLATDGEFFNFDDLQKNHEMYAADIRLHRLWKSSQSLFEIQELQLLSRSSHKSLYGTSPLLHYRHTWKKPGEIMHIHPFAGVHYRKWYSIDEGIYGGVHLKFKKESVFSFTGKISPQFFTLMPQFKSRFFHFTYSFKNPHRNPQDDIWVNAMHNISLSIPFP